MVKDPIRSQVENISTTLDTELFVNKLNDISSCSGFAAAVGITNENPQYCEMFESPTIFKSTTPLEYMEDYELF